MSHTDRTLLLAGCGYLGLETARLFKRKGWRVCALTRTSESARDVAHQAGIEAVAADISDPAALRSARGLLPAITTLIHCASTGGGGPAEYEAVYVRGLANLIEVFAPDRLLFTSSTSVYRQNDGSAVDETSETGGERETTRILLEAEAAALAANGTVARLSGIYGPDRSAVLRGFFHRTAVLEDGGGRVLNQIHRDDAASALFHLLAKFPAQGEIFNVSDCQPMTQREILEWLAALFAMPVPPVGPANPNRKRGVTSKRVSVAKLLATGWTPEYPSFRDAVQQDGRLAPSIQCQLGAAVAE